MKFEELPVEDEIYTFVGYRPIVPEVGFNFLFKYSNQVEHCVACKSCNIYAFYRKVLDVQTLDKTGWKPLYIVAKNLKSIYNSFRALEKELNLKPCEVKLVKTNLNIDILAFYDPRYRNILTIDFLAILLKISNGAKKDYYDFKGKLLTILDNAELALEIMGKENTLNFEDRGGGLQTWAQYGLLNKVIEQINLTKHKS